MQNVNMNMTSMKTRKAKPGIRQMVTLDEATVKKAMAEAKLSARSLSGMLAYAIRKHFGTAE